MKKVYQQLRSISQSLLENTPTQLVRDMYNAITWSTNSIIIWQRWIGKSTLLLQHLKKNKEGFYFSADQWLIASIWLFEFVRYLVKERHHQKIYIDEIFRYQWREQEIKNCLDSFPTTLFFLTWSNSLQAFTKSADFVRRIDIHHMSTLTFREFLKIKNISAPTITIDDILSWTVHPSITDAVTYTLFEEYLESGAYPMISSLSTQQVHQRLLYLIDEVIVEDIWSVIDISTVSLMSMKKLFYFLWSTPPSDLSITWLSKKLWVNRATLESTLHLLHTIWMLTLVPKFWNISDTIRKEYKILLGNTTLYNLYNAEIWTLREAFFVSMIRSSGIEIYTPRKWDYIIKHNNKNITLEIGGKSKTSKQIQWVPASYIVKDELVPDKGIPLRQFGLLT